MYTTYTASWSLYAKCYFHQGENKRGREADKIYFISPFGDQQMVLHVSKCEEKPQIIELCQQLDIMECHKCQITDITPTVIQKTRGGHPQVFLVR